MRGIQIARELASLKKERNPRFRESVMMSEGRAIQCGSARERNWWEQFKAGTLDGSITPHEFSIRDLFEALVPDGREMVNSWNPQYGPDAGVSLSEAHGAITSSDFSNITGQIVYSQLMQSMTPEAFPFQNLIPTQSTPFSGEKIAGVAGLGDMAEVVAENEEFPLVGTTEDYIESPETLKRGFIVPVTKEALFFDRTGLVLQRASAVGNSLMVNKEKRAIDCVIDENTTAHRHKWRGTTYATYQTSAPWDNVTTSSALQDWTDLDEAEQTLNGITDPNTGEPVVVEGDTLICVKGLEHTANRILSATELRYTVSGAATETVGPNPYRGRFRIVTSRLLATRLATDTNWFWGSPERAYVYMQNWPITVTQAPAGSSEEFKRDIVAQFKCSERGQYFVREPRVMSKSTQ